MVIISTKLSQDGVTHRSLGRDSVNSASESPKYRCHGKFIPESAKLNLAFTNGLKFVDLFSSSTKETFAPQLHPKWPGGFNCCRKKTWLQVADKGFLISSQYTS